MEEWFVIAVGAAYAFAFLAFAWNVSWPTRLRMFGIRIRYEDAEARRLWESFLEMTLADGSVGALRSYNPRSYAEDIGTAFLCDGMLVTAAHVVRSHSKQKAALQRSYLPFAATPSLRRALPLSDASWWRFDKRDVAVCPTDRASGLAFASRQEAFDAVVASAPILVLWYRPFSRALRVSTGTFTAPPFGRAIMDPGKIYFLIARPWSAGSGASGSPLIVRLPSGAYRVIGVHVGGSVVPLPFGIGECLRREGEGSGGLKVLA